MLTARLKRLAWLRGIELSDAEAKKLIEIDRQVGVASGWQVGVVGLLDLISSYQPLATEHLVKMLENAKEE
jgi:hypothetical protein